MKMSTLIWISQVAGVVDVLVVGEIPGASWFLDVPVIHCHVSYSGPIGFALLLELVLV